MKLIFKKVVVIIMCVPLYPLVLFADWYDKSTHLGAKFNFRKSSKEYWADVWDAVTYKD